MHRALTVVVVLALLAGSVPAAATLADGTPSDTQPGASFSGVVGVQESEVDSEVAERSLDQRLNAAKTNSSKASVVADQSEQLADRLAELEAEKERLKRAYENGSISKGEYQARLAVLAAELRAIERRANKTATVAEGLPAETLREKGANVSEVRAIAQRANETGGGEVAEAARTIAGSGVGNGLGNAPNASQGPPDDRGNGAEAAGNGNEQQPNETGAGDGTGAPTDAGNQSGAPADARNGSNASDETEGATGAIGGEGATTGTMTDWAGNGGSDAGNQSDASNGSTPNDSTSAGNNDAANQTRTPRANESAGGNGQNSIEFANPTDWFSASVNGAISGLGDAVSIVDSAVTRVDGAFPA